jgi:hypothetical protein
VIVGEADGSSSDFATFAHFRGPIRAKVWTVTVPTQRRFSESAVSAISNDFQTN